MPDALLKTVPLDALHRELGAKMVPFAGYSMPVQYRAGIIAEHQHCRNQAALFDVSHMGQVVLEGSGSAALLESLTPANVQGLALHAQAYTLLTTPAGGVIDDLIITRWGDERFFLVINASRKDDDLQHLRAHLNGQSLTVLEDRSLLALQGPMARAALTMLAPDLAALPFLRGTEQLLADAACYVSCSGYTGEDGFELSIPSGEAERIARMLLENAAVAPAGLGARDSLRLEAGLCLYGHELSETTSPIEAGLAWAIAKPRRRAGERAGGFPGADVILEQLEQGPARRRVGLAVQGKRPVRDGQPVLDAQGVEVGSVCSAAYGATLGAPVAMAYVCASASAVGTELTVMVRDTPVPVAVTRMPFVPQRYFRGPSEKKPGTSSPASTG